MSKKINIIAVIPARGGSKGIKNKNLRLIAGKPLIAYSIEAAKQCSLIDRIIVSTDDEEISRVAQHFGAEAPFIRPAYLAGDDTPTEPVLKHTLDWLKENENYDADILVFLQPTDIFRKKGLVQEVVDRLLADNYLDSVFVATKTHKNFWRKLEGKWARLAPDISYGPRQKREPLFREDTGLACATRAKFIRDGRRIGDRVDILTNDPNMPSVDIHDEFDIWLSEKIIAEIKIRPNE